MTSEPRFAQAVEMTIATYDRAAEEYARRNVHMPPFWAECMDQFLELLNDSEDADAAPVTPDLHLDAELPEFLDTVPVLDAGCGPGRDARALAERGLPVLAADLSQGMLDVARERTARKLPRGAILYALMDLRRLELPDAACRAVWCSASLLHLPKSVAPRAVAELSRVVRGRGPIAIFLKLHGDGVDQGYLRYAHPDLTDATRFFAYYTEDEARRLVEAAGLAVVSTATAADARVPETPGWLCLIATHR